MDFDKVVLSLAAPMGKTVAAVILLVGLPNLACCQILQKWVSPLGSSTNTGTAISPLLQIGDAVTKVDANGIVMVKESGTFSGFSISKNVSIDSDEALARVELVTNNTEAFTYAGATINEGANSVTLKNLTFTGDGYFEFYNNIGVYVSAGTTLNVSGCTFIGLKTGIHFLGGSTLNVENCTFTNCETGIYAPRSTEGYLKVSNCAFKNCPSAGVRLISTSGNIFATLENIEASNCFAGLWGQNCTRATLRNSTMNCNVAGVFLTQTGQTSKCVIDNCMISNNSAGMSIGTGGTARVLETSFIQNNILFEALGGVFESDGTNVKISNVTTGPAPGIIPHF